MDNEDRWGIWPGDTELMDHGMIFAITARESNGLLLWMQPVGVEDLVVELGEWSAVPMLD